MESNGFSVVVPTFREAKNVSELVRRIAHIDMGNQPFELILVDDNSEDGIIEIVNNLRVKYNWVNLIVRNGPKSLSQSVLDGFQNAKYPILFVMDADLSHPPEKIPEMLKTLLETKADLVIGSRYVTGGSTDEVWPLSRKLTSWGAAKMARILLNANVQDPLSGFLAIRKNTCFSGGNLEPIGWKIGLELMIKCHCKTIREVPIHFSQRRQGASKLNLKIAINYIQHVKRLMFYKLSSRTAEYLSPLKKGD